ncbi:MAG: CpsD/CapB family tyrosine-protein kinase [Blastocatellia bacterium]|nr:CpsD/CapB family tyrosine-protein kinase [Blastocatellia bacterium]
MKFLNALQKGDTGRKSDVVTTDETEVEAVSSQNGRSSGPQLTAIGAPKSSAGRPDVLVADESVSASREALLSVKPSGLDAAFLARVPTVTINPDHVNPHLVAITSPTTGYCEEYRNLRTQLFLASHKQRLQSIVISSVAPAEGKSVTALNLAWLFAQTEGVTALVIDTDLRRPSLAKYLGLEVERGMSQVLDGTEAFEDAIIRLQPSGLFLLPGGGQRRDVAELVSGPVFKSVMRKAHEMFDFVIIDAPPLGVFTDATVLMDQADGALLVVRANKTKFSDVGRILESVPSERMLGVVLNASEDTLISQDYYDHYYSSMPQLTD